MFNFLKSLFGITLVALLGYVLYNMATQRANDSIKTLRVSADNTTTISGVVLENKHDCFEQSGGGKCFLKLRVVTKEVYVIYNANDSSFCANEGAAGAGKNIRAGQTVKVYGFYRKDGNSDTILTCPTANYFIQTL
jgi:hypothetical protein